MMFILSPTLEFLIVALQVGHLFDFDRSRAVRGTTATQENLFRNFILNQLKNTNLYFNRLVFVLCFDHFLIHVKIFYLEIL